MATLLLQLQLQLLRPGELHMGPGSCKWPALLPMHNYMLQGKKNPVSGKSKLVANPDPESSIKVQIRQKSPIEIECYESK